MHRHDERKKIIVEEANALARGYFQVDLMPSTEQPQLRALMKDYLRTRPQLLPVAIGPRRLSTGNPSLLSDSRSTLEIRDQGHQLRMWIGRAALTLLSTLSELRSLTTSRKVLTSFHPSHDHYALSFDPFSSGLFFIGLSDLNAEKEKLAPHLPVSRVRGLYQLSDH